MSFLAIRSTILVISGRSRPDAEDDEEEGPGEGDFFAGMVALTLKRDWNDGKNKGVVNGSGPVASVVW